MEGNEWMGGRMAQMDEVGRWGGGWSSVFISTYLRDSRLPVGTSLACSLLVP